MPQHVADGFLSPGTVTRQHDEGGASPKQSPAHLLVVDDQEVVRDFLTHCLEDWGYSVTVAESALEALHAMVAQPAAVVFCDIRMPVHDGLWLLDRLRDDWPDANVIMTTAIDDVETV